MDTIEIQTVIPHVYVYEQCLLVHDPWFCFDTSFKNYSHGAFQLNSTHAHTHTHRFRPVIVKELIHKVLMDVLNEKQYSSEEAKSWSRDISDIIKTKLKGTV